MSELAEQVSQRDDEILRLRDRLARLEAQLEDSKSPWQVAVTMGARGNQILSSLYMYNYYLVVCMVVLTLIFSGDT